MTVVLKSRERMASILKIDSHHWEQIQSAAEKPDQAMIMLGISHKALLTCLSSATTTTTFAFKKSKSQPKTRRCTSHTEAAEALRRTQSLRELKPNTD